MLDLYDDQVVSVDNDRDQGFLAGHGHRPGARPAERPGGADRQLHRRQGRHYQIACHQATQGAVDGGRTAMEQCLSRNPDINVVYTINEPAGEGAYAALKAGGGGQAFDRHHRRQLQGVGHVETASSPRTPRSTLGKMAQLGVDAISPDRRGQEAPVVPPAGLPRHRHQARDRQATAGITSQTVRRGPKTCWGAAVSEHVAAPDDEKGHTVNDEPSDATDRGARPSADGSGAPRGARRSTDPAPPARQPGVSPLIVLVLAVIVFGIVERPTSSGREALSLLVQQVAVVGALAVGQTLIILTAGIDLSIGMAMVLSSLVMVEAATTTTACPA